MAIQFVQKCNNTSGSGTSTTITATMSENTSEHNLIVITVHWDSTTVTCSVSDGTNSGVSIEKQTQGSNGSQEMFYMKNITGLTTPTFTATFSSAVGFRGISVCEYSGADQTDPLDQHTKTISNHGSGTDDVQVGPLTPSTDNQLLCADTWNGNAVNITTSAGTNRTERINQGSGGSTTTNLFEDLIQTTAQAAFMTWTSNGVQDLCVMATFKAAAAGYPYPSQPYLLYRTP